MKCFIFVLLVVLVAMVSGHGVIPRHPRCRSTMEKGHCHGHFTRYGYDQEKKECVEFQYSGCGGNHNRFHFKHTCELICKS